MPDAEVRHEGESSSVTERRNIPRNVESGVTYRDVEIRSHAQARVATRRVDDE
jgi:hypothetical protein